MSNIILPALFYSLGGEMLYVLDQRLRAQEVALQKGTKVMSDIVGNMFGKSLTDELFKRQPVYSRRGISTMFERLVHSSIMRIDADSMEKLYDLMIMTFKYQLINCRNLSDLLHIVLNHLDSVLNFVKSKPEAKKLAAEGFTRTVALYENLSYGDLIFLKQSLFAFLHDSKSKVSIFVSASDQNPDGTFAIGRKCDVPVGTSVPGTIHYCDNGRTENFTTGLTFTSSKISDGSTEIGRVRSTDLGLNLYAKDFSISPLSTESHQPPAPSFAEAEVKLLGHLMGAVNRSETLKIDLFKDHEGSKDLTKAAATSYQGSTSGIAVKIEAERVMSKELLGIKGDFSTVGSDANSEDVDLLSLMDDA